MRCDTAFVALSDAFETIKLAADVQLSCASAVLSVRRKAYAEFIFTGNLVF